MFFFQKNMGKHARSNDSKILRRIRSRKRGWVFTPDCLIDLGSRPAIDTVQGYEPIHCCNRAIFMPYSCQEDR